MESIENMREITIEVILSGGKTREEIEQSIDNIILNVKCNMIGEELVRRTKEYHELKKLMQKIFKGVSKGQVLQSKAKKRYYNRSGGAGS
ncbi:hypothetical protein ES707_08741 [subsurface metagenome]